MRLLAVIQLVRSKDGGRYKCLGSWRNIMGSKKYSMDLEGNGSCLTSFTVTSRGSPVLFTTRMQEQMKSTSCDAGCSAWRQGMLISISYLPVTTHFASMHLELTARPQFGNEVSNDAPKYLRLLDVAGALKMAGWRLIRWVIYQPQKQFWNCSCCLANAAGPVSFHRVPLWQMAWNALTSVAFRIAPTGVMIMMSMMMTMTMRTAVAGKGLVIKYRVVCKEVEPVTGKKYFLSFVESAVAYHLWEP